MQATRYGAICVLVMLAAGTVRADVATIRSDRDNMMLSNSVALSNGSDDAICVGRTAQPATRRSLIRFDVAAQIPPGSIINSVTLDLFQVSSKGSSTVEIHAVLADWGEGASAADFGGCIGAPSELDDASWRFRFYDPSAPASSPKWDSPGGDFDATASASTFVVQDVSTHITWTSAGLAADVQGWLDDPGANFGWLVKRDAEVGSSTAIRFASRESFLEERRPTIFVDFTAPVCNPDSAFELRLDGGPLTYLDWTPQPGAQSYDVIRGDLDQLDLGPAIDLGTVQCIEDDSLDATTRAGSEPANPDTDMPANGRGFFYLLRSSDGASDGSYGLSADCSLERLPASGDCP